MVPNWRIILRFNWGYVYDVRCWVGRAGILEADTAAAEQGQPLHGLLGGRGLCLQLPRWVEEVGGYRSLALGRLGCWLAFWPLTGFSWPQQTRLLSSPCSRFHGHPLLAIIRCVDVPPLFPCPELWLPLRRRRRKWQVDEERAALGYK